MTVTTFTSGSGSFTVPAGNTSLQIEIWGKGGIGSGNVDAPPGGGGGGGGYSVKPNITVVGGTTSVSYAINSSAKTTATIVSPAVSMLANNGVDSSGQFGGVGGSASGGATNSTGSAGTNGNFVGPIGGNGGNSPNGGTGGVGVASGTSNPGNAPGGGGGGNATAISGGNGAAGQVTFTYPSPAGGTAAPLINNFFF